MEPIPENLDYQRLSLADAAIITGKSKNTIRRRKARLEEVGATCSPSGWVLTVEQLAAVGLLDTVKSEKESKRGAEPVPEPLSGTLVNDLKKQYEARITDLQNALEREKDRADLAEKRLERLLPPGPTTEPVEEAPETEVLEVEKEKPRGFFARLFNLH